MKTFTIGFLGRYHYTSNVQDYVDSLILNYLCRQEILVVMVFISGVYAQKIAERVLTIRRICPSIKLRIIVTEAIRRSYEENAEFPAAVKRRGILEQADRIDMLSDGLHWTHHERLHDYFIQHSDLIIYSPIRISKAVKQDFKERLNHCLNSPQVRYLDRELPCKASQNFKPAFALAESIAYIRGCNFRLMSDRVPLKLLKQWLTDNPRPYYRYFSTLEDVAGIFNMYDSREHSYLPFKIFAYCYAYYRNLWILPMCPPTYEEINTRFGQFQKILRLLIEIRLAGGPVESCNIMDFDRYDELVENFSWIRRLNETSGHLSDGEYFG